MFLLKFLRYIKSYVTFTVTGGFFEKFINMCTRAGIALWDVTPTDTGLRAATFAKDYKKLRPIARKTRSRIKVDSRFGMKFKANKYKKRSGIAVGLAGFALFLIVMSNFIWKIDIYGNEILSEKQVLSYLKEYGVKPGAYKRGIDTAMTEHKMMLALDEISWIAVNIKGATIDVEIIERTPPPERIDDQKRPTNVVASETGQIKRAEVYDGTMLVRVGDTVLKGDMIVSGIVETKKGITVLTPARAKIMAVVQKELVIEIPFEDVKYLPTGTVDTERHLRIFGLRAPLSFPASDGEYYNRYEVSKQTELFGIKLPFVLELTAYEELERVEFIYTEQEALARAFEELALQEKSAFVHAEILTRETYAKSDQEALTLTAFYTIYTDIAETREILKD